MKRLITKNGMNGVEISIANFVNENKKQLFKQK
jgi:hypothetical protein